jgi:hypothetical protein
LSGQFTKISQSAFENIPREAGVLLKTFSLTKPDIKDADIICATTGGIEITCNPSIVDDGEDIDNCPKNAKELQRVDGWECGIKFTSVEASAEVIRLGLGVADVADGKITPRAELADTDFSDIWWVGDRGTNGLVAVRLINALSTGGYTLKTTKNGKGQTSVELTGYTSLTTPDMVPMEFYSMEVSA